MSLFLPPATGFFLFFFLCVFLFILFYFFIVFYSKYFIYFEELVVGFSKDELPMSHYNGSYFPIPGRMIE